MNPPVTFSVLAFATLTSVTKLVQAAPANEPSLSDRLAAIDAHPPKVPQLSDLRLNAGLGAASGKTLSAGFAGALMTTYRYSLVEGGLLLEGGSELIGGSYGLIAGVLGPVWQSPDGPRLELLGVAGRSAYSGIGCGLFCDSGGASASMGFLGARAGVSYVLKSRKRGHLEIGGSIGVGSDLQRKHVDYTTTGSFLSDGTHANSTTLGGLRTTALFVLGTSVDLGS